MVSKLIRLKASIPLLHANSNKLFTIDILLFSPPEAKVMSLQAGSLVVLEWQLLHFPGRCYS